MQTGRQKTDAAVMIRFDFSLTGVRVLSFLVMLVILAASPPAPAADALNIPSPLEPWKQWVLHNMDERLCPTEFNREDGYQCVWPSRLELFVKPAEGRFELHLLVFAKSWVSLPGGAEIWPTAVKLADQEVPLINRSGIPSIEVGEGEHVVSGFFEWQDMPEVIQIPANSGLIALNINDQPVASPVLDKKGRLWLQKRAPKEDKENRLEMHIFRLLDDEIPLMVTSHLQLDKSGYFLGHLRTPWVTI